MVGGLLGKVLFLEYLEWLKMHFPTSFRCIGCFTNFWFFPYFPLCPSHVTHIDFEVRDKKIHTTFYFDVTRDYNHAYVPNSDHETLTSHAIIITLMFLTQIRKELIEVFCSVFLCMKWMNYVTKPELFSMHSPQHWNEKRNVKEDKQKKSASKQERATSSSSKAKKVFLILHKLFIFIFILCILMHNTHRMTFAM